jgi:hypothetical protein
MTATALDQDPAFEKLLSDNREKYIAQSAATKNGVVAQFIRRIKNPRLAAKVMRGRVG